MGRGGAAGDELEEAAAIAAKLLADAPAAFRVVASRGKTASSVASRSRGDLPEHKSGRESASLKAAGASLLKK